MAKKLELQDPGEGIHEVEIREVLVSKGDEVNEGDPVLVVESDKAAVDIPAPYSGKVTSIEVAEGDTASVGSVLMTFDGADDEAPEASREEETASAESDAGAAEEPGDEGKPAAEERDTGDRGDAGEESDAGGESDAGDAEESRRERGDADEERDAGSDGDAGEGVPASPVARRAAAKREVDLEGVEPSGPHGRVLLEDVERAAGSNGAPRRAKAGGEALPDFSRWGPVERQKLRSVRRATAQRMARSWAEIPHVTHQDVVDITELEDFRRRHAREVEAKGGKLTLTVFAMRAAVAALKEQPRFNASLDPESHEIVVKHYHHLGVAVETEQGLLVPVVRDVDRKSLVDLAIELAELADQARSGKLEREAMRGSSFTISNVGALGGTGFTPIINHPDVAILGLAQARWQPVVQGEPGPLGEMEDASIVPRLMLPLMLAFDHRVVDGAAAARFVRRLAATLADVETFTLVG